MSKAARAVILQAAAFALAVGLMAFAARYFGLGHVLMRMQQRIGGMEWWGALLYPLLVAACNLLLLPGSVLTVGSGLFFGLWWGTFLVLTGNVLGAAIAFGVGRLFGRAWVEKHILKRDKWARLDQAISREGWKIIFLSQVHPLFPTSLLNYFYGITRIRFRICILWIAIAQAPGIFLYAYLGTLAQLGIKLFHRAHPPHMYEYFIWFGGLFLTAVVSIGIGRVALKLLGEMEPPQPQCPSLREAPIHSAFRLVRAKRSEDPNPHSAFGSASAGSAPIPPPPVNPAPLPPQTAPAMPAAAAHTQTPTAG